MARTLSAADPRSQWVRASLIAAAALVLAPAGAEPAPGSTFHAGLEADDQDSMRFDLAFATLSEGGTGFDFAAARTDTDWSPENLTSTHAVGLVSHDFGRFGLAGGLRYIRDEDYSETLGLLAHAFVDFDKVRLTARLEGRNTDFDATSFTASGEDLGLEDITSVTGTSRCGVDSLGYGLAVSASLERWSFYASAMAYDYDSYDCKVEIQTTTGGGGGGGGMPGPGWRGGVTGPMAQRMVDVTAQSLAGYTSTLLPRDAALLESSLMAGAAVDVGSRSGFGLEYYHEVEEFAPVEADTLLGYFSFDATPRVSLELTVGATDADGYDTAVFVGLGVYVAVGD